MTSDRAIRFQAEDLDEFVAQAVDASSNGGESDIVSLASGRDRYLSLLLHIFIQVLALSSMALSSWPSSSMDIELNRQLPSAFTLTLCQQGLAAGIGHE